LVSLKRIPILLFACFVFFNYSYALVRNQRMWSDHGCFFGFYCYFFCSGLDFDVEVGVLACFFIDFFEVLVFLYLEKNFYFKDLVFSFLASDSFSISNFSNSFNSSNSTNSFNSSNSYFTIFTSSVASLN